MDFMTSVKTCFSKYVDFSGRARRSEYWWFVLSVVGILVVAAVIDGVIGTYPLLYGLAALAIFLPSLAAAVRRLHDTDKTGWLVLLGIIPIVGPILLIVFYATDSTPGDNKYGPNPKGQPGMYGGAPGYPGQPGYPAQPGQTPYGPA